jgi:predicted small lipoprotein YifL
MFLHRHNNMTTLVKWTSSLLVLAFVGVLAGCGQSGPARSPVKGVVKLPDGKPVDGGALVFAPITSETNAPSAPTTATVNADGTFEVKGGVVAGKQRVMYEAPQIPWSAPEWDGTGSPPQAPQSPYANMKPKLEEVDIANGPNDLTVELNPPGA